MKRIIFSLACCLMAVAAQAQTDAMILTSDEDGTAVEYALSDNPRVSFSGDNVVVTTTSTEATYYAMAKKFTVKYGKSGSVTSIDGISTDGNAVSQDGSTIRLSGLPAGSGVYLYDVSGKVHKSLKADADGRCELSLADVARGVYIVKAYRVSAKITKK